MEDFQGAQVFLINRQYQTPMEDLQGPQGVLINTRFPTPGQDLTEKC